jgi:L-alanine-DL-glutamate epimerase-like enolase superfamily enzyme
MPSGDVIESVRAMSIYARIPVPIVFGDWVMKEREFALVEVRSRAGAVGNAYCLTRDGAVPEQIRRTIAPVYCGTEAKDRERTFRLAWRRSLPSHAAGVGHRALSVVDLACWDLAAKTAGVSIARLLGGKNAPMKVTAIIGFPPGRVGPDEIREQARSLHAKGWRRFKAPMAASHEQTAARMRAAREAVPMDWLGLDGVWTFDDADVAAGFINGLQDVRLGWFEDVFPPGNAARVRALREKTKTPIAMGDDQGGAYFPEALIALKAVDVVRVDLTTMGGITFGREIIQSVVRAGLELSPHMFPHIHSQVFAALGHTDVPVEWGLPGTGVHPMDDPLRQPMLDSHGHMAPLPEEPGFGPLVDTDWIREQRYDDPDGILAVS